MDATREYDEQLDKIIVTVPLEDASLGALREALGIVVMNAAFPDRLLRRPEARLDDLERAFTNRFEFVFRREGGEAPITERSFFELCAAHRELYHRMDRYVMFVRGRHEQLGLGYLWHDDVHPAGCYALAPLVLRDEGHVDELAEYLIHTDLEEETIQSNLVRLAFATHGWSEATLRLLALRLATSHGQWSQEDLAFAVARCGLLEHLERSAGHERFLDFIVAASRRAGTGPSLSLGTLAFVFGGGQQETWRLWAERARAAHDRELVLVEPGPRYGELYGGSLPDEDPSPDRWDQTD